MASCAALNAAWNATFTVRGARRKAAFLSACFKWFYLSAPVGAGWWLVFSRSAGRQRGGRVTFVGRPPRKFLRIAAILRKYAAPRFAVDFPPLRPIAAAASLSFLGFMSNSIQQAFAASQAQSASLLFLFSTHCDRLLFV